MGNVVTIFGSYCQGQTGSNRTSEERSAERQVVFAPTFRVARKSPPKTCRALDRPGPWSNPRLALREPLWQSEH
jgi:hypothetical protein